MELKSPETMNTNDLPESQDPVWDLLAKRPQPPIPQDFVAQVMAEVRQTPQDVLLPNVVAFPGSSPAKRSRSLLWGSLAAAAAVVLGLFLHFQSDGNNLAQDGSSDKPSIVLVTSDDGSLEQELTAVQDVHALIAVEDPKELNDAQLFALLN